MNFKLYARTQLPLYILFRYFIIDASIIKFINNYVCDDKKNKIKRETKKKSQTRHIQSQLYGIYGMLIKFAHAINELQMKAKV